MGLLADSLCRDGTDTHYMQYQSWNAMHSAEVNKNITRATVMTRVTPCVGEILVCNFALPRVLVFITLFINPSMNISTIYLHIHR